MRTHPSLLAALLVSFAASAGAQFSAPRELPGDLTVGPAAGEQRHASSAAGNGQSLVVYEDHRAALGDTVAYSSSGVAMLEAVRLDFNGAPMDSTPITIRKGTNAPRDPRVAWNGSNYLVVWDELVRHTFQSDRAVFAARVSPAGQLLDDPPILLVDASYVDESYPVVASDGTNWAVAWSDLVGGSDAIRGCIVDANGIAGPIRTMMTTSVGFYYPVNFEMAWSNGRYLFVSQHLAPGGSFTDVLGQLFDPLLAKVGTEFNISAGAGTGADPWVAGDGNGFCVAWRHLNLSIRATPVDSNGTVVVPGGVDLMGPTPGYAAYQLPSVAWNGSDWAIAFGTGSFMNGAMNVSRLSPSGVLLGGAPMVISQGAWAMSRPSCAPVPNGVQIVWDDERMNPSPIASWAADRTDVFSSIVTSTGAASTPIDVSQSPPAQLDPQIAGDAQHGYLTAFFSVTQSTTTIAVQRLDAAGRPVDAQPIALLTGPRTVHNLAVAWSGSNWMVVWEDFATSGSTIYGMRVAPNGTVLDPAPISIMPGSGAAVAAVGGEYLVAASHGPTTQLRYVYTRRVLAADGSLLDPAPVARTNVGYDTQVAVAAFQDRWILAWAHMVTHNSPSATIRYMLVYGGGGGSAADLGGAGVVSGNNEPVLATDGLQALLSWTNGGDVVGRRIAYDGSKLDTDTGFPIANAGNTQFAPTTCWNGQHYVVAYGDYRAHVNPLEIGIGDVYASLVDASGAVLDANGTALATELLVPEGRPSVAGTGGVTVAAWTQLVTDAPFGNWRIAIASDLPPTGTRFCSGDGSGTACPCGNAGATGNGCASSVNPAGGSLTGQGVASVSGDSLVLTATGVPDGPGLFFQATQATNGGAGVVFGDGLRCGGGVVVRLGVKAASGGVARHPQGLDPRVSLAGSDAAGDSRVYQLWYRDASTFCSPSPFNLTNGLALIWTP